MSMPALHQALEEALELSVRMLATAADGDWDGAARLQQACDEQIRLAPLDAAGMPALRQLQHDQATLLALASAARDEVSAALARHRTNHRAVSAYLVPSDQD
jgi:hypothetical protein